MLDTELIPHIIIRWIYFLPSWQSFAILPQPIECIVVSLLVVWRWYGRRSFNIGLVTRTVVIRNAFQLQTNIIGSAYVPNFLTLIFFLEVPTDVYLSFFLEKYRPDSIFQISLLFAHCYYSISREISKFRSKDRNQRKIPDHNLFELLTFDRLCINRLTFCRYVDTSKSETRLKMFRWWQFLYLLTKQ